MYGFCRRDYGERELYENSAYGYSTTVGIETSDGRELSGFSDAEAGLEPLPLGPKVWVRTATPARDFSDALHHGRGISNGDEARARTLELPAPPLVTRLSQPTPATAKADQAMA